MDAPAIAIANRGAVRTIVLSRTVQHNVLDVALTQMLLAAVPQISRDANAYAIVLRASEPGWFCAGFDLRELARLAITDPPAAHAALDAHYALIWMLECLSKPVVALLDGAVTAAGAGLTLVNTHRVAGAGYRFAVPGVHMGLIADAGTAFTLARLPDELGTYLALTGASIERADAFALGLVTHCIGENDFSSIEAALADAQTVDPLLDGLHQDPGPGPLATLRPAIAASFAGASVETIAQRLAVQATGGADPKLRTWAAETLSQIERSSPIGAATTLRQLREARDADLRHCLTLDHRLARRLIGSHDFQAAVRARLVDGDREPAWLPARVADLAQARIDDLFRPDAALDLHPATRQEMQAARI